MRRRDQNIVMFVGGKVRIHVGGSRSFLWRPECWRSARKNVSKGYLKHMLRKGEVLARC
jgi:hypothetical protein